MKKPLVLFLWLGVAGQMLAADLISPEDRSRFVEEPYKTTEPGFRSPADYIAMAKVALHRKLKDVHLNMYTDGRVTRRYYHDVHPADREMICVEFVYEEYISGGGYINRGIIASNGPGLRPAILVLFRKDLSKIYVNVVSAGAGYGR